MTAKQAAGEHAPDGSIYVTLVDGDGSLALASGSVTAVTDAKGTAAAPTYVEGDTSPLSQNLSGDLRVIAKQSGAWTSAPQAIATGGATHKHIAAGQATTVVKASAGTLYAIVFNGPAAATNVTTVYDDASGVGTVIAIPLATAVVGPVSVSFGPTGVAFATGLTIITATANGADMTVIYK